MTSDEAIAQARAVADANHWPWLEPLTVRRRREYWIFGHAQWLIVTHANARGGNVRVLIEDRSGKIKYAGLAPM